MKASPILIVIPARNEEATIGLTLQSVAESIREIDQQSFIVVVCDRCEDLTAVRASAALFDIPSLILSVDYGNVGLSRDYGVKLGLQLFPGCRWIAFTDADTLTDKSWLSRQVQCLSQGFHAYFGRVAFDETSELLKEFAESYARQTHKRIHGANMGLSVSAYIQVGGIPGLAAHEDRVLSERLQAQNLSILWDETPSVKTSVRLEGRVPEGFAATLNRFVQACDLAI